MLKHVLRKLLGTLWRSKLERACQGLGIERLEDRALLSVTASLDGTGRLALTPDTLNTNNTLAINRTGPTELMVSASETIQIGPVDAAVGSLAAVSGGVKVTLTDPARLTAIALSLRGGNDRIDFTSSSGAAPHLLPAIQIDVGNGSGLSGTVGLADVRNQAFVQVNLTTLQVAGGDAITLGSDLAADRSVALASQKSIDTQGHDLTATGAGSGIVFDSQAIRVTNGTALKASGDIVLRAQDALDTPFSIANPFFRDLGVQASVVVASGASLDGANIRISADSNSSKIMEFQANPLAPTTLLVPDANVGMDEAQKLTFSASARTITRTTGTWASDGFTPGMFISVQDSEKNSAAFKILSLNGLTMTLTTEAVLVDETATAARVVGMKVELDETGSPLTVDKVAQQFARSASLLNKLPGLKVVDQNIPFASLQAEAVSSIDVGAGANLRATGDVFLSTLARNNASFENSNRILGFTYASAKASATTTVAGQINAGGIVEVAASVRNRLKVGTKTESDDANAIGVSFTFGDGESTTQAVLADGGRIEAGKAVRLLAGNINEFEVSAGSKGDRGSGLGIAVADVDSTSTASVRGQIKTAGTVDVHAQSINLANDVKAEAVASSAQTTAQSALKKLKETSVGEKLFNLPLIGEKLQKAETTATPTESGASAALVISLSDNLARAEVVPATGITTNQVDAGGSVRITSTAINNYQNSAVGSAKGSTTYAVGGAVVLADHTNKAFATIDAGASVTTGREVVIDATALIPNQIDLKTDLAALKNIAEDLFANPNQGSIANDPDASSSGYTNGLTARISENVTAAKALAAMADYFSPDKLVGGKVASTFAGANAKLQTEAEAEQGAQQGKVAGSGSFTYVNVENLSDASIGAGAVVTTGANLSNTPVSLSNAASIQVGDTVVYHKGTGAAPLTDGKAYTLASRATGKLYFAESQPVYFDPRLQVNRGLQANTLTLDGFENGTPVLYRAGGGKPIAGLVDGKVYYVIVVGKNAIQLATTAENARNRRQIQINGQDVTSGGHSLTKVIEVATTTPGTLSLEAVRVASNASVDTIDVEGLGPLAPTSGGAYSIGGSLLVSRMQNRSLAHIEDAAQVTTRGGDVSVVADSVHRAWHVVLSGGAGGKYAVNGAIGIHLGSNETLAYVEDTATVNSAGKVRVLANADVKSIEVEGALNTSANAIGITAGIYSTDVTTRAFVGPRSGAASATGTVTTGSDLVVRAVSDQRLYSFAIAGALAKNQTPGAPAITDSLKELITGSGDTVKDSSTSFLDRVKALRAARSATPVTENAGLGLSGAVTFVESDNTVEAFVSTATVTVGGDLTVEARGNQTALAVAGAGALSTGAGSSKGISGSAAIGLLDQDVNAQVSSATVRSRSLTVNAVATQKVQDIAAGAAGGLGTTGGLAVAGSASINLLNNEANADLGLPGQPTQVTTTGGGVDVTASATLELLAVGGGLAVSSGKGAGAGFVVGFHDNAARARIADNSRVTSQGPVGVRATTTEKVQSIAAQLTGTQQGFGVAGSMVLMVGSPTSLAEIGQAATVTITGSGAIVVRATDDATLTHVAGAASLSMTGSAIGGSVVVSILDREVTARVGSQAVLVGPGGITVEATSTDKVLNLAAAGGIGGGGLAIEGSVLLHVNDTDTMAEVGSQAQLTAASQSISILARQTTKGSGGAGALAVSRGGAVGASIDLEFHEGDTRASVGASARLDAGQQVMVQAFTTRTLTSVAAAASLGGGSFAGAGSYLGLALAQQTHATIGDSAVVQAGGNVLVTADSVTNLTSVAGSGGIGKTAGVAASIIVVATDDDVQASIGSGAQVDGKGNTAGSSVLTGQRNNNRDRLEQAVQGVAVVATSSQDYLNVAAGAGLGGSAGLAGSIIVLVPVDTTRSLIGADARINTLPGAGPNQGVYLLADDDTRQLDVAGAVAAGGSGGIGAGIDVTIANKTTEATIGDRANVKARQHIQTVALSDEDATIAAAALGVGGSAGLAGSFGISGQTLVTRAIIGPAATVSAEGNVVVSADDHFESDVGAGAGGVGGSAGFGASIDAAVIDKTVEALVQPGAIVVGKGTRGTSNVRTAAFHKGSNSGGEGEVAAPPLDPSGATRDADTDRKIAGRIAPPEGGLQVTFAAMKGVAVTATSVDDVEQITISGAVGGSVGLTVSGSFYGLAGTTRALIGSGAQVNQGTTGADAEQSVAVLAGSNLALVTVGGSLGVGGSAGVGVGGSLTFASSLTEALIDTNARVSARRDVQVVANSTASALAVSIGFGAGGVAGIAGAIAVLILEQETVAAIGAGAVVFAGNNVLVSASDRTSSDTVVGSLGIGFKGGVGASLAVVVPTKVVEAKIGTNAVVDGRGQSSEMDAINGSDSQGITTVRRRGVIVQALSRDDITTLGFSGGGGLAVGAAGGIAVDVVEGTTRAIVESGARINQTDNNAGANAGQDVHVAAVHQLDMLTLGGALGVGAAGIAGGVDIGVLKFDTKAVVGDNVQIRAADDVAIEASANRQVESIAMSAGAGAVGLAGAVSVYTMGSGTDASSNEALDTSGRGPDASPQAFADNQSQGASGGSSYGIGQALGETGRRDNLLRAMDGATADRAQPGFTRASDSLRTGGATSVASKVGSATPSGTVASVGVGGTITAGDDVTVKATEKLSFTVFSGSMAGGAVGIGGSVTVLNVADTVTATLGGTINAGGDVTVAALLDEHIAGQAIGGTAGFVGLGAQVLIVKDTTSQGSSLREGTVITKASVVTVRASATRNLNLEASGASYGGLAAGVAVTKVTVGGETRASVGNNVQMSGINSLHVEATSTNHVSATTVGVAAGVGVAVTGNVAEINLLANGEAVAATIGTGGSIDARNEIDVEASSNQSATAVGVGVALGGGLSAGLTLVSSLVGPNVSAEVRGGSLRAGNRVRVRGRHNVNANGTPSSGTEVTANGIASAGGLVGLTGGHIQASQDVDVQSIVSHDATIVTPGEIQVRADANRDASALAGAATVGFAGVGVMESEAKVAGTTSAIFGGRAEAGRFLVTSTDHSGSSASTYAVTGGLLAAGINWARATTTTTSEALLGPAAYVTTTGDASVVARTNRAWASATVSGANVGAATLGVSDAEATIDSTTSAGLRDNAQIDAADSATVEAISESVGGKSDTSSGSGALLGLSGTESSLDLHNFVTTTLGAGAILSGQEAVTFRSLASSSTETRSTSTTLAGFAGQDASATSTVRTTARALLSTGSQLLSGGIVTILADNSVSDTTYAKTKFLGLGSLNRATATTTLTGHESLDPLAQVTFGEGSLVEGDVVNADARISRASIDSDTAGEQYSAGGLVRTTSNVNARTYSVLEMLGQSQIVGDIVRLNAALNGLNVDSYAFGKGFGVITAHDGQTFATVDARSSVRTAEGSILGGNTVVVAANTTGARLIQATKRSGAGIDTSKDDFSRDFTVKNEVVIAGVLLGIKTARLRVDAAGNITQSKLLATRAVPGAILIDRVTPDSTPGTVSLSAPRPDASASLKGGTPKPDNQSIDGTVTFSPTAKQQTADRLRIVDILNRSSLDLRINSIDTAQTGSRARIQVTDADNSASGSLADGGIYTVTGQRVQARSDVQAASNVTVLGSILNQGGVTILRAGRNVTLPGQVDTTNGAVTYRAGGSVTGTAVTTAADLTVEAKAGGIGTVGIPLPAAISQVASGKPAPGLELRSNQNLFLTLRQVATAQDILLRTARSANGSIEMQLGDNNLLVAGPIVAGPNGDVTLTGVGGIVDKQATGTDITGRNLVIQASREVASLDDPLETVIRVVEAESTGGGLYLSNIGEVTIGTIRSDLNGLRATGGILLATVSPINVKEPVLGGGDVRLVAGDTAGRTDDEVKIDNGLRIESTTGNLSLLSGDTLHLNNSHRLVAAKELTLGMDWGNADGGPGITFTVPTKSTGIITAASLRILTSGDDDTLILPEMYLPTTFEAGLGRDTVVATLLESEAPSAQTRLTNIDVDQVNFTSNYNLAATTWLVDTVIQARPLFEDLNTPVSFRTVQMKGNGFAVVENMHHDVNRLETMTASYTFGSNAEDLTVLRLDHTLNIDLGAGNDTASVGGLRDGTGAGPGEIFRPLNFLAGDGNDTFQLRDLRNLATLNPVGRFDRVNATTGLVRDYGFEQETPNSPRSVYFTGFEAARAELGPTSAIFSINNTVAPTTVEAGDGDDVINVRRTNHATTVDAGNGDDDINVQGVADLLTVRGGTNVRSLDLPEGGDRLRIGVTRTFNDNVVNVVGQNNPSTVGILGHGWFSGQEVIFSTSGTAPTGLVPGRSYFVIREDRNSIRLAATREDALAAVPVAVNIPDGGLGDHQLTMAENGKPLWGRSLTSLGTLDGTSTGIPFFTLTQPGAERSFTVDAGTDTFLSPGHGLVNGRKVALLSDGTLPGQIEGAAFYVVTNATADTFQLRKADNSLLQITNEPGSGNHVVVTAGDVVLAGNDIEKVNALLGTDRDTFVMYQSVADLQMEVRGNAGDDTFVLFEALGTSVLRGDKGFDTIRTVVHGDPHTDQFAGLQISAGIEQLLVDNSDNPQRVSWYLHEGSLYFANGSAPVSGPDLVSDVFSAAGHGFATGDRILLTSTDGLPTYLLAGGEVQTVQPGEVLYAIQLSTDTFALASSPDEAQAGTRLDFTALPAGSLTATRLSLLVGAEGAEKVLIAAGQADITGDGIPDPTGTALSSLTVLSNNELQADISGNTLRLIDGLRVLDHTNSLAKLSFPAFRVDGLEGARDVVTLATSDDRRWVIGAGTAENELAIFERRVDATKPTVAYLEYVTVKQDIHGVPAGPAQLVLSSDNRFLYVVGSGSIAVMNVIQRNGLLDLTASTAVTQSGITHFVLSQDGTLAFVADTQGVTIYDRNAGSGALVFRQRITAANVTPVASGPVKGLQGPTSLVPTADASRLFVGDAQGNLGTFERQSNGSYTLMTYVRVIRSNYEIQLRDLRVNNAFDSDNSDEVFIKYDGGSDIFNSDRSYTFPEGGGPYGLGNMPINTLPITYEFRENVSGAPDNSYGTITFNPGGATGFYRAYSFANRLDVGYQIWEPESETLQGVTFAAGASIADMRLSPDGQSLYLVTSAGKLYTVGNLDAAAGPGGVQLTSFTLLTPEDSDGNDEIYIEKGSIDFFNIDHLESFAANVVVNLTSLPVVPLGSTIRFRESNIGVTDPTYGEIQLPPGSPLGTFSTDMVVSNSTGTLRVNYRVVAGDLAQVDLETDGQSSLNGIASAQTLAFSANGKYLYVTGKRSDGNAAIVLFDIGTDNKLTLRDPNTTLLNPQFDGVGGDTSGLGTSVVGSALEGTFGAAGAFADFASSSTGGLVSFKVDADGILTFNQGPNRNAGAYPYGTGDGDPAGRVERVQGLTVNPVYREMYVVAPRDNNLYVLTEFTRVDGSQVFKVFDFYHDEADGVTGLQGAAAVTVSRDGQHVYVLTPGEPGSSHIALFDRQPDGKLLYRQNFDSVVLGGAGQPDATYRAFTGPDGTKLYVSGPAGTEVFTIAGDGSLTSLQTIVDSLSSLEFVPGSDRVFATAPSTNLVLVFDVASGLLTNRREVDPQASSPAAVVASPAIAGSMTAEAGRHVYVAAAGSNSITVYVDRLGDGNLSRLQVLREGARGIRGLEGVSALMLSAAVIDARLNILPAQVDAVQNIFTVEFHGLKTGQKIVFDTAPAGLSAGTPYFVRRLTANTFQLAGTEAEARLPGGTSIDLQASSAAASLRTDIPAGAYLYAVGTRDDSITIFERDSDPRSPTFGRLTFTQTIRNRIGNRSSGANDGLFRPDAIGAIAGDPSQVFVSSRFDPLIDQAPGGLVTFRNNAALSTQLPPIELNVEFVGMRDVAIFTGDGNDRISVLRAPKHLNQLIDLTIRSGAGNDEVTLNALGAVTTVDTGAGDDRFIVRRKDGLDPVLNATTGTGDDDIEILEVGGDTTTVTIDTGTGRDNITVEGRGIAPTNSVTLQTDANDTGLFRTEGTETAGNVQTGTTFQVAGQGAVTFGAGTLVTVENQSVVPVARAAILPGIVLQGQGVQLDASASILPTTGTITYAWDLNRDGAFTELVTSSPTVSLTWDELLDRLFMDDTFVGEMTTSIPLRVTRTVPIFDTEGKQIGEEVRESFDEAALTLRDVLATLYVQAPPSILMGEGLPPLTLILSYTDPGNDRIVAWTVSWGDGSTEIFDSEPTPTHVYRKPGVYSVEVQALDEYGQTVQTAPRTVTVTLDPSAMNPGGPYAIDEGRSLTLAGSALGDVDAGSFTWIVNGQTAGQGATLNLTWSQLTALGVTNDGTFEVRLQGTYNNGAHAVTSGPGTLVVRNLPPSATVENSGPINEDDQAFIHVRNVSDVVDVVFSYSYDFDGSGTFVPGSASQAVPASVTAKSGTNPIKVRVFDGTDFTEYETELVVREVGPTLTIQNRQTVVVIDEGAQAELPGTITNPGADAITWNATVGTVAEEGKGKWRWTYTPDDGPAGSQTVTITATDADGLSHSVTFELIVVNVGPTATFVGDTIDEGQSATVSFQQVSDPSAADRAGGFIYSYDFGDGNWITGGTSMVVPAQFLPDNGSIEVRGRIQDKDGESIFTTLVQVRNVAPSISNLTITPVANEGGLVTLEGSFTDPGAGDIHTLRIVWGDDEFDEVTLAEGERTFRVTHRYRDNDLPGGSNPGTYTVRVVLNDDDGGTTDSTQSVQVSNVTPVFGFVRGTGTNGGILLQGQYGDAGLRDGQTLQVNWGDGTTSLLRAGGRHVIDFDTDAQGNTLATGQIVRNQFVTADGRGFTVTTTRAGQPPMIFDTNAPGTNTDLGTANQAAGGPGVGLAGRPGERGENLQPLGKALIIAASRNSANPQDSERGGVLKFNFRAPVIVESIDLLDVARRGGVIRTFDARGKLVSVTRIPLGGANSLQRVALKQAYISRNGKLLPRAISRMEVVLAGGGAITRLAYRYADNDGAFALFHAMKKPGKYQVKLTLTDDDGAQVVKYLEVLVPIKKAPITLPDNGHGRRV